MLILVNNADMSVLLCQRCSQMIWRKFDAFILGNTLLFSFSLSMQQVDALCVGECDTIINLFHSIKVLYLSLLTPCHYRANFLFTNQLEKYEGLIRLSRYYDWASHECRFVELKTLHGIADETPSSGISGPQKMSSGLICMVLNVTWK